MDLDIFSDIYMSYIDIFYQYELIDAFQESMDVITKQNWLGNIQGKDQQNRNKAIAKVISPLTEKLLSISGEHAVRSLPQKVKNWIADTAILAAEMNGETISWILPEVDPIDPVIPEPTAPKVSQVVF